jgi:hypothetical protein
MKTNKKSLLLALSFFFSILFPSCEEYLDKAPESSISEKDVFGSFFTFQGFIEQMYCCITDYNKCGAWNYYLLADETYHTTPQAFDVGNFWSQKIFLYDAAASKIQPTESRGKRVWSLCWQGIRMANVALARLDYLADATQEEKDLIKGQALFFRGWFHFELARYWGGLPYIDRELLGGEALKLPRLNYRETALKAAEDFRAAADLLPVDWDQTQAGQRTAGSNRNRVSKVWALSYLGKNYLYAASPMMNEESTGNNAYDAELCKKAADAFGEALKVCDQTQMYKLQPWSTWTENFWVYSPGYTTRPGGTEVIMPTTVYRPDRVRWSTVGETCPQHFEGGSVGTEAPTHNLVKNYGMASGLPIDDPNSGYDPADPWANREPRFYSDIVVDGDKMVETDAAGPDQYMQLYNGGRHRDTGNESLTGYFYKRFSPLGCNKWENKWDQLQAYVPYMRLADVYLMYAEAVLHGYGLSATASNYNLTPAGAINIIRNRAQLPNLTPAYSNTKEVLMETLIRERAVELAFEAHRFHDLRRWNVFGEIKYREKTAIDFDRDPVTGKPINMRERVLVTRVIEKKHNWLPLPLIYTNLYPEFGQNPGW